MKVELLDYMGDDLAVVNSARVSFAKESEWEEVWREEDGGYFDGILSNKDAKLIHYLAKHHHWTPFSHCYAKFRIKAPLFVRSQLFKHKVGLTENEVSRRYVDSEPEFYVPDVWRKRAEDKKQGSSDEAVDLESFNQYGDFPYKGSFGECSLGSLLDQLRIETLEAYRALLKAGVAPEQARSILPTSTYTEWIWSGSIAAFARVYQQRTSEHAQHETRTIAYAIGNELRDLFPVSWKALTNAE